MPDFITAKDQNGRLIGFRCITSLTRYLDAANKHAAVPLDKATIRREKDEALLAAISAAGNLY
jgi:hypothetical protein